MRSAHSIFTASEPDRLASIGYDETVSSLPTLMGQGTVTPQRALTVGVKGKKLYVDVYVAVPFVTCSGTDNERRRVEFWPGTVGSGENDMDVIVKSAFPFEQSETEALTVAKREMNRPSIII